jgi:5'-nucleotidase
MTHSQLRRPTGRRPVQLMWLLAVPILLLMAQPGGTSAQESAKATPRAGESAQPAKWPRRVLLTNDDGIHSRALHALARALAQAGIETYVAAPSRNRSGTGSLMTSLQASSFLTEPMKLGPGIKAWAVNGFPADCVLFALRGPMVQNPPDLVISGPNHGGNVGEAWFISGTVGAARAAAFFGVPAVALSGVNVRDSLSIAATARWSVEFVQSEIVRRLQPSEYLNVNVPVNPRGVQGVTVTRRARMLDLLALRDTTFAAEPRQQQWLLAASMNWQSVAPGTDAFAFDHDSISIQPLRVGEQDPGMTAWLRTHLDLVPAWPVTDQATREADQTRSAPTGSSETADRDVILARLDSYYADLSDRNWSAFASHFWPGATLTTVFQPPDEHAPRVVTTSVPAFVAQATQQASQRVFHERMQDAEVVVTGDIAQVRARYEARISAPDARQWTGTDAFTLMKHGGEWRIVSLAYTTRP